MTNDKYNLKEMEERWRRFWEEKGIYRFNPKSKKPFYSVDTPPPYVSAEHLHAGHIMSYSQAEFIVRFKRMQGFEVFYPMGFDDNGLPTERFVEKKYNLNKQNIARSEFVKKCLEETKKGAENYRKLWQALGISVDWNKTYSTINPHCQRIAQWSFLDLYQKGRIYRKRSPIMWCPYCQTAISQADLQTKEVETNLVYIKAKTKQGDKVVFATTRPELLPSCVGMSVNPTDKRYQHLVGKEVVLPITGKKIKITTDQIVDPEFGTGVVYFCSSGDRQFLDWESRHPVKDKIYLLREDGRMNEMAGPYEGLTVKEARLQITKDLQKQGFVEKVEKIVHNVPAHERCNSEIEYVDSWQWFVKVLDAKEELKNQADKMNWYPLFMKQKYLDWIEGLKWDWCISRQRYFGVPFPVWYCNECQEIILADEEDLPVDPTEDNPPISRCKNCGSQDFEPERDVMDTWMTSSLTPIIGAKLVEDETVQKKLYPASLRPQAFDIIRTWLFYTVVKSLYHHNTIPFKDIMISGHGVASDGRKFSKRLGNYEPPENIIDKYGADALRYWATGATLGSNLRYNEHEVKKGRRTVIKLLNAAKFCFHHLKDEDFFRIKFDDLNIEDKWIFHHLNLTIKRASNYFNGYSYSKAKTVIEQYFWHYFCDNYLEFSKHRLYQKEKEGSAKTTLYHCFLAILKMYAPILPFVTEEIYQRYFRRFEKKESIHLTSWPTPFKEISLEKEKLEEFERAVQVIEEIRAHKTQNSISLAKEIPIFEIKTVLREDLLAFIKKVARVKELRLIV